MAKHEQTPKEIADSNQSSAFDVFRQYNTLGESLGTYRENVGDTIQEYYPDDKAALREGLKEYDRLVEQTFDQMHKEAKKMSLNARNLFDTLLEAERDDYNDVFKDKHRYADALEGNPGTGRKLKSKLLR